MQPYACGERRWRPRAEHQWGAGRRAQGDGNSAELVCTSVAVTTGSRVFVMVSAGPPVAPLAQRLSPSQASAFPQSFLCSSRLWHAPPSSDIFLLRARKRRQPPCWACDSLLAPLNPQPAPSRPSGSPGPLGDQYQGKEDSGSPKPRPFSDLGLLAAKLYQSFHTMLGEVDDIC